MNDLSGFVKGFVIEAGENLDRLERDLLELENNPKSRETLSSIFRTVHTIKGGAAFVGLSKVEALAHSGESVLSQLRDGALVISPPISSALLALADGIREMIAHVDRFGDEGVTDGSPLIARLAGIHEAVAVCADTLPDVMSDSGEQSRSAPSSGNVRVTVEQLDRLMNLVGELVLARNEIVQFSSVQKNPVLLGTAQRLNAITTQLQEGIMKTRMQPIDNVWNKLPRIVRDTAQQCGKMVRLDMEGRDTELDRTLIEAIQDPLTHLLRNCIDHGLELPARRTAAGKSAEGRLSLRAFHEGGQVIIEVSDDGAGINVAAIRRKALEGGMITPEQARSMSEPDLVHLIFLPGLSTATKVTSVSGRGVGMDVVKTNIERIGGRVSVQSQAGVGTTLKMRIPLTLAIMTALVVTSGDDDYAIPQVNVIELVRLEGPDASGRIEMVRDAAVYRLRGELLPVVWLTEELAPGRRTHAIDEPDRPDVVNLVVLQADNVKFALVVDEVSDMREIVVKPLSRYVRGIPIFAGATITGNARVALILDVPGLAVRANVLSEVRNRSSLAPAASVEATHDPGEALLLFAGPDAARMAVRLSQVKRLETFSRASIECVGGRAVVQYVDDILPLAEVGRLLTEGCAGSRPSLDASDEPIQALVYSKNGRQVGVIVDQVLDTIEQSLADMRPATRRGIAGSLVIQGRATEILDLDVLCAEITARAVSTDAGVAA